MPTVETVMELHENAHRELLRLARGVAVRVALKDGDMDAGRVVDAMRAIPWARDVLDAMDVGREARRRWLGALVRSCRPQVWEWTGRRAPRGSAERNTNSGGEGRKVWSLIEGADVSSFLVEVPDLPPPGAAAASATSRRRSPRAVIADLRVELDASKRFGEEVRAQIAAACRGEPVPEPCCAEVERVVRMLADGGAT